LRYLILRQLKLLSLLNFVWRSHSCSTVSFDSAWPLFAGLLRPTIVAGVAYPKLDSTLRQSLARITALMIYRSMWDGTQIDHYAIPTVSHLGNQPNKDIRRYESLLPAGLQLMNCLPAIIVVPGSQVSPDECATKIFT
jgi:hypothetical protein